jgi:TonB-linked SusC/RagA family outer membrane protein
MQFNCNYLPGMVCPGKPKQRLINRQLLRIMRLTTILLTVFFLQVKADGLTQSISFSGKNVPLQKVLQVIKKQSGYVFFYKENILQDAKPVTIDIKNVTVEEAIRQALKDQPFDFYIESKTVVISKKKEGTSNKAGAVTPDILLIDVKGRVVNEKGEPVPRVSVTIKGTNTSTVTDENGDFTLRSVEQNAVLVFSHVSMESFELKVSGQTELAISLKTKISELSNVSVIVSTGYQDIPKERATGSFVKIDNELFNRTVSTNILDRIYNVTSGLVYTQSTGGGVVGGLPPLQIRGASTINANKDPLIVVDNFPYNGRLNNINPNDVESITVLKDAAAASIWGIQSGNGVIVITTKKGRFNQKPTISFNSNVIIGDKPDLFYIPTVSSSDVIDVENKSFADSIFNVYDDLGAQLRILPRYTQVIELLLAARKGKITKASADQQIDALRNHDVRNDINKYLLQKSLTQQYAFNVSGGSKDFLYYGSLGYDHTRPVDVGSDQQRFTLRLNNTWKPISKVEMTADINYAYGKSKDHGNNWKDFLPLGSNGNPPYLQLADANGNPLAIPSQYRMAYVDTATYPGLLDWHYRPLDELKYNANSNQQSDIRIASSVKYEILKGLNIKVQYQNQTVFTNSISKNEPGSYAVRNQVNRFMNVVNDQITYPFPMGTWIRTNQNKLTAWNLRSQLDFNRSWRNHEVYALAGIEINESNVNGSASSLIGFDEQLSTAPVVDFINLYRTRPSGMNRVPGTQSSILINDQLFRNGNYFSNVGYTYKKKYLLNASARMDESNLFGVKANQRRVPLWSTGIGWFLSDESFYNLHWLNNLKIRATYGHNGNASRNASAFPIIAYVNSYPANYGTILNPNNPQLRWERVKMINLGIDFGIFENKISGSLEYYHKQGIDLLGQLPADPTSGWSNYLGNYANIKGNGIDFVVNTKNLRGKFSWETNFSISYNTDKVTKYNGQTNLKTNDLIGGYAVQEGKSVYAINSYKWAGLDPTDGSPMIYIGDTISSFKNWSSAKPSDLVYNGSRSPKVFGYLINTFRWKNLQLSCNLTYKLKYFFRRPSFDGGLLAETAADASPNGGNKDYELMWSKKGDEGVTNVPAYGKDDRYTIYGYSNILVEKGDHIRLQDIRLSYDLSKSDIKRLPVQGIQLYFYANNVGILWRANKMNIDPEAFQFGSMPAPRTYSFGLRVTY